eukprot:gene18705-24464_t
MKKYCIIELSLIDWINNIQISIVPKKQVSVAKNLNSLTEVKSPLGLEKVKNIIAVSSCKGGVGKSTVAVNLAYTLAQAGARVGILDADIYGPSLPTMTKPSSTDVIFEGNMIKPLEFRGVKLMSMGYISKGAAIMRGPMVNQILNQFVSLCNWGELDYLLLDMPPGTGDIQLTLAQIMNITAAVIVTTPQRLSFVDVVKGIDLFDTVNVPCVAVVENMAEYSTYQFDDNFYDQLTNEINTLITNQKSTNDLKDLLIRSIGSQKKPLRVFGLGHSSKLRDMWGIENQVAIPLLDEVSLCGDIGTPYVLQYPDSPLAQAMIDLAGGVISEIEAISLTNKYSTPSLNYLAESNEIKLVDGSNTASIKPFTLRDECRCAVCVEEFTGKKLLDEKKIPIDIKPLGFSPIAGGGLGTITAIPQLIRVLSNKGEGEVLTNAVNNVIIDAGAVVIGAAVWFYENKKQNEKLEVFKDKEKQLSNRISVSKASEREIELSKLPIEIQVSEYNETSTSIVSLGDLQSKGRQHVIIVAGEREIVKDAVISARIEGSDLFNSKDTLVIPLVLQENEQFDENIGKGFGNKEGFLSAPYIGKPTQPNVWQFYLDKEVQQAIKQGQLDIVTKGLVLAIRNDGKIIRRGIGLPPWKEIVEEFTKKTK